MATAAAPHVFQGQVDDTRVLRLTGPIRFVTALALRPFVDEFLAGEQGGVLIDLRDVEIIDSTGMGLLARIGRASLRRCGRRAAISCPDNDIASTLKSASFDELFVMLEEYPFDDRAASLDEVPLDGASGRATELGLGHVILDAHRDLASVSPRNVDAYRNVIAALEADLGIPPKPDTSS